jgi:hypothetical protein
MTDPDDLHARLERLMQSGGPPQRKPGRNEGCWCGSGKKYKRCHWDADRGVRTLPKLSEILKEIAAPLLSARARPTRRGQPCAWRRWPGT